VSASTRSENAYLELAAARASADWPTVRRVTEQIIADETATAADTFLALAQACWHLKMLEAADNAAQSAMAADPTLTEAVIVAAWVALARDDGDKAVEYYRRLAELNPQTARWQLKLVQLLNTLGRIDEASREMDVLIEQWPNDRNVRTYLKLFGPESPLGGKLSQTTNERDENVFRELESRAPGKAQLKRPLVISEPQLDVQVAAVNGTDSAVLVFTGGEDGVAMPLAIFDRYMATLEATTIYLKDFSRRLYLGGIKSLSADYDGTVIALRELLVGLGVARLAAIGNCNGAAAAIRYGMELGADHILAFSPITHFPGGIKLRESWNLKGKRLVDTVAPELIDLKPFLHTRQHSANIKVLYCEERDDDKSNALRISQRAGVYLHPVQGHPGDPALRRLALTEENFSAKLAVWLGVAPALSSASKNDQEHRSSTED
jgi:tetratricopeptide (TPR) repeat protein